MKMRKNFQPLISKLLLVGLLCLSTQASANSVRIFTLSADQWARPRIGAVIPEMAAVRSAVSYWGKGTRLMIVRYPGEDSGELWAAELRDWLISLGVPSDYIRLLAGSQAADEINIVVGNRDEMEQ
ncbi:MAG: hypothetical protein GY896_15860 [Gammaproteobacteria bacterium]|nr:hypothetical protein [Gammaproteobacteria bacterium]